MPDQGLVKLAMKELECNQAALAKSLGVTSGQVSKWMKGEYMSSEMRAKITKIANIGSVDPDFILACGSIEDADKWENLINYLIDWNCPNIDLGMDHTDFVAYLMGSLIEIGVKIPKPFPPELALNYEELYKEEYEEIFETFISHPVVKVIDSILKTYEKIDLFISLYIFNLGIDHEKFDMDFLPEKSELLANQLSIAIAKTEIDPKIAPIHGRFTNKWLAKTYIELDAIKRQAIKYGIPLEAELMDLINKPSGIIDEEAEYADERIIIHPDIYMNELLINSRMMAKALPIILKKIGCTPEEIGEIVYDEFIE